MPKFGGQEGDNGGRLERTSREDNKGQFGRTPADGTSLTTDLFTSQTCGVGDQQNKMVPRLSHPISPSPSLEPLDGLHVVAPGVPPPTQFLVVGAFTFQVTQMPATQAPKSPAEGEHQHVEENRPPPSNRPISQLCAGWLVNRRHCAGWLVNRPIPRPMARVVRGGRPIPWPLVAMAAAKHPAGRAG